MESIVRKLHRSKSPVRINIGVSWREIEEAKTETENINVKMSEQIIHTQEVITDLCLEYKPILDAAWRDEAGCGGSGRGEIRQDKDSKTNLKEVGEKTENYFKRVNVFSHDEVRPDPIGSGEARQDKEVKNEDL